MSSIESKLASRVDGNTLLSIVGGRSKAQIAITTAFAEMFPDELPRFGIDTALRLCHFIAQTAHESDAYRTTEEYASGAAYEGRKDLGNTKAGDGKKYKGRGPIQLTGRGNYHAFTQWLRKFIPDCPDFEQQPELAATFPWAGWAAVYFWTEHKLNALADKDDLVGITLVVNGGRNGLTDRSKYLARAKTGLATLSADLMSREQVFAVMRRGMTGASVEQLQRALAAAGTYSLSIDGFFGPGTEQAVRSFQKSSGLDVDGVAGAETVGALRDRNFLT